jgi:F0F1-type ATP synthase assembly protein I
MRRAHIYLASILLLHIGYVLLYAVQFWSNVPDGDMDKVPGPATYWIPLLILLYFWCKADAKDRHVNLPLLPSVLVPLLFPIGVPYYFLRTYARRRALLHIGLAVIFAAACLAVAKLTYMLAFYYLIVAR